MFKKNNKILDAYFFILFSLLPVSIIVGPSISLSNILLIDFSFIFLLIFTKENKFLSNKTVKLILIFYLYLIFNSIISENFSLGALRNFGFIRFLILFCAFNYFFYHKSFFNYILIIWALTLFIVMIDIYIESFTGKNILGYGELYGKRIVSFFKDEPIVGGYVNAFYLIVVGYFFSLSFKSSKNYNYLILLVSISFLWVIFLTGERSNAIRAIFGFVIFYFINNHFKIKEKLISVVLVLILFIFLINNSDFLKSRFKGQILDPIVITLQSKILKINQEELDKDLYNKHGFRDTYSDLYDSAFHVFKDYPFFGVGNKNYRHVTCNKNKDGIYLSNLNPNYVCSTHPHQVYFEFLSEHGLIGTIVLLYIIFNLFFSKIKIILQSKNYIQIGCFIFLCNLFIPFLPSGAFFSDNSLTIFWLNLSLMYSINKKTNIFSDL